MEFPLLRRKIRKRLFSAVAAISGARRQSRTARRAAIRETAAVMDYRMASNRYATPENDGCLRSN
jgi:hypothetical protein